MTQEQLQQLASLTLSRWSSGNSLEEEIVVSNEFNEENPYDESLVEYEELSTMIVDHLETIIACVLKGCKPNDIERLQRRLESFSLEE